MKPETIKALLDACYLAKRIRDLLPALPKGVTPAYITYLDVITTLEQRGKRVKISDISDALNLPRPGVTRTVKEMGEKGYLCRHASQSDGRITYISITEEGKRLSRIYNEQYFERLGPLLGGISEEEARCAIQTIEKFYRVMAERSVSIG